MSAQGNLVTFALFTYNQERFIREAVEGALAQDYSPLEIILSDDCSTDRTFDVMSEMVYSYRGPHQITLIRNEKNLGIGGHVDKVLRMSQGSWVVMAAGDDISLPTRTRRTMDRALDTSHQVDCVAVQLARIDEEGQKTGVVVNNASQIGASTLRGAGLAYSRRVIEEFGELNQALQNEDIPLLARAFLLSSVGLVTEPLVLYRSHMGNKGERNRSWKHLDNRWIVSKCSNAKRMVVVSKQIETDTLGRDPSRIPDYATIMFAGRKAAVLLHILENGYPKSLSDAITLASHADLLKILVGLIVVRFKAIINRLLSDRGEQSG